MTQLTLPIINAEVIKTQGDVALVANQLSEWSGVLAERAMLASAGNLTFRGKRNIPRQLGYEEKDPTFAQYRYVYERKDVFGTAVDKIVGMTWSQDLAVKIGGNAKPFADLAQRLKLFDVFRRLDTLATIGEYAVLFYGFTDQTLENPTAATARRLLRQPLEGTQKPEALGYVQCYAQDTAKIKQFEANPFVQSFGRPSQYEVTFPSVSRGARARNTPWVVHSSRTLHVAEGGLESSVFGRPIYKRVFDRFHDYEKVVGGTPEMFWQNAAGSYHANASRGSGALGTGDTDALRDELEAFTHGLNRYIPTTGVDLTRFAPATPDPEGVFGMLQSVVAGGFGIPKRIIFGSERGELASTQDRENFAAFIIARRTNYANPCVLMAFVEAMQALGVLPAGVIETEWPNESLLGELERAEVAEKKAKAMKDMALDGDTDELASVEERRRLLGLEGDRPPGRRPMPNEE